MAASLSVVPLFIKSKLQVVLYGENSILSRLREISRSFVNIIISAIPSKVFLKADSTTLFVTRYWHYGWSFIKAQTALREKTKHESEVVQQALRDCATEVNASTITSLYCYILDNNFFGITSESLELLRYESKVLQGLQDFELLTALKSLFGCMPGHNQLERAGTVYGVSEFCWNASITIWRAFSKRLLNIPVISWILPFRKVSDQVNCATNAPTISILESEESSNSSQHTTLPSAGSILMCETSLLPTILSDSGSYALSTTHDLLKEAILLFVPMEMLENAAELLKGPHSLSVSVSPVSAFWQLFNYVSIWGLDIMEEVCNQPEINYVNVDDDDFHFVVNVPKLRRPILFIGIR